MAGEVAGDADDQAQVKQAEREPHHGAVRERPAEDGGEDDGRVGHDHGHAEAEEDAVDGRVVGAGARRLAADEPDQPGDAQPGVAREQRRGVEPAQPVGADHAAADVVAQQPQRHEQTAEAEEPIPDGGNGGAEGGRDGEQRAEPEQGGDRASPHGELRQLGALRGDGDDDEAGQQRDDRGDVDDEPEPRGEREQQGGQRLRGDQSERRAPPQREGEDDEAEGAVEKDQLAERRRRPREERERAAAQQRGNEVGERVAHGLRALERDEGAHEAEHHHGPVEVGDAVGRDGCPDADAQQPGVEPGHQRDAGQRDERDPPRPGGLARPAGRRRPGKMSGHATRAIFSFHASGPRAT